MRDSSRFFDRGMNDGGKWRLAGTVKAATWVNIIGRERYSIAALIFSGRFLLL